MLPVSSSDPATTTTTSPRVKTAPVMSVWTPPHACWTAGPPLSSPAGDSFATSPWSTDAHD
jgi:hypothetical protein